MTFNSKVTNTLMISAMLQKFNSHKTIGTQCVGLKQDNDFERKK